MIPLIDQIESVAEAASPVAYIAGGAARYHYGINHQLDVPPPGDIDLWLINGSATLQDELQANLRRIGYHYDHDQGQALQYRHKDDLDLQVTVIRQESTDYSLTYGPPIEVINHFSFTVEQFAYYQHQYFIGPQSIEDQVEWRLRFTDHISCPVAYQSRVLKYVGKGYHISFEEHTKLLEEYHRRPQVWRDRIQAALALPTGHIGRRVLYLD